MTRSPRNAKNARVTENLMIHSVPLAALTSDVKDTVETAEVAL